LFFNFNGNFMIRLVVSDLDGTLLDSDKRIHDEFWIVEQQLAEKGILFSAASGRQYYSILDQFERVKERVIIIAENGTYVARNGVVLHKQGLDKEAAREFIDIARKLKDVYIVYCCENSAYIEKPDERFYSEAVLYNKRLQVVDDVTRVDDYLLKFSLCDFAGAEQNSLHHYKKYENDFKVVIAGQKFLDITHPEANKGSAVKILQEKFSISPAETLVFGDYPNDLEMMDSARYSYAMKNAHPEILKKAPFVTEYDNNNNGVVEVIKKYCLNGAMQKNP
jgi:Cof subfamily protein (haloacid dehalogenase superfamily)